MRKPAFSICKNKEADKLRSNCAADQRRFCYMDSTIILLSKSEISNLYPSSVTEQPGLCQTNPEDWFSQNEAHIISPQKGVKVQMYAHLKKEFY